MTKKLILAAMAATCMTAVAASPAQAVTFNLIDLGGAGIGTKARTGFETAAYFWSSVLKDNAKINISIGFSSLGNRIIGQTASNSTPLANVDMYAALRADQTSSLDRSAVATLQPLGLTDTGRQSALTMTTNALNFTRTGYLDTATRIDNDGGLNNTFANVQTAQIKALGLTSLNGQPIPPGALDNVVDGRVTFNSDLDFDFDPRDGIGSRSFDFIGTAIHEIGHALGFSSGVDFYDAYTGPDGAQRVGALESFYPGTLLDYFRYSAPGVLDWSTQNTPYLSADGGATQIFGNSLMSTGTKNGDGRQASHWKDDFFGGGDEGVMDPTLAFGREMDVTALDLAAFDMVGYDIAFDPARDPTWMMKTGTIYQNYLNASAVPEPATWAMMIAGFGLVGGTMRRRQRIAFA